jgi:hypothetical protein
MLAPSLDLVMFARGVLDPDMKLVKAFATILVLLGVAGGLVWQFHFKDQVTFARIATAYGAKMVCSCRFVAERPMDSCMRDFTTDLSMITFQETGTTIRASVLGGLVSSRASQTGAETGCTLVEK